MRARGTAFILVLLLAVPPSAWAQTRDKKAAAAHFQQGRQLFEQNRWSEALAEFQSGYESYPLPGFLVNIGQCYRKLERFEEARDTWLKFLQTNPSGALRAEVDEALAEVRVEIDKRDQEEGRRRAEAEAKRKALFESIERDQKKEIADLNVHPSTVAVSAPAPEAEVHAAPRKKSRWWVWTIVGVVAAGAVASAVAVGVIYGTPKDPQPGSLGLLDGRRQ